MDRGPVIDLMCLFASLALLLIQFCDFLEQKKKTKADVVILLATVAIMIRFCFKTRPNNIQQPGVLAALYAFTPFVVLLGGSFICNLSKWVIHHIKDGRRQDKRNS